MYEDKTLVCKECGNEFIFSAGEQEYFAEKGLQNEPKRCKTCRDAKKNNGKKFFTGVCAACGKEAKLPFEPKNGTPVYCSDCYSKLSEE